MAMGVEVDNGQFQIGAVSKLNEYENMDHEEEEQIIIIKFTNSVL